MLSGNRLGYHRKSLPHRCDHPLLAELAHNWHTKTNPQNPNSTIDCQLDPPIGASRDCPRACCRAGPSALPCSFCSMGGHPSPRVWWPPRTARLPGRAGRMPLTTSSGFTIRRVGTRRSVTLVPSGTKPRRPSLRLVSTKLGTAHRLVSWSACPKRPQANRTRSLGPME